MSTNYSPYPSLPYSAFRQAVRAFAPSALIPAIAKASAAIGEPPYSDAVKHQMPPWGLAAAARESLLHANEYRAKSVDYDALRSLMRKFQIAMTINDSEIGDANFLTKMMTRITYEQFPYQESMFEELSRSHAWLVEGLPDVETRVITNESLASMLDGVPLRDAIGATFVLQVGALKNEGKYQPDWLDQENFTEVLKVFPRRNIKKIATRLTTTRPAFQAAFKQSSVGTTVAARFDYNPLVATPFVDMGEGEPVAPVTRLILRTVTPGGLYYAGMAAHGSPFANDMGRLFEHYIGRQLRLIDGADVEPEIVFGKGGGQKSVDWFVVLPGLVVLVEVKSRRLGPAARTGDSALIESLDETLGGAKKQLTRTVENLAAGHSAFSHIPTDRPMIGLIVTAEPFYTGTAYLLDHTSDVIRGGSLTDVPVAAVSAREIEWLVTHGTDVEAILLEELEKHVRTGAAISLRGVGKRDGVENPILVDAWNSYPWPSSASISRSSQGLVTEGGAEGTA